MIDTMPMLRPRDDTELRWYELGGGVVEVAGATDRGRMRERNEDQFLIADLGRSLYVRRTSVAMPAERRLIGASMGRLLIVADGVGGQPGGDLASAVAVDAIVEGTLLHALWPPQATAAAEALLDCDLRSALIAAEARIRAVAEDKEIGARYAATTVTLAMVLGRRCYVAHAGDSRCYHLHGGSLAQMTRDHTIAAQLPGATAAAFQHVLVNAVGGLDPVGPELSAFDLADGDTVLLCSDGLTRHLSDREICTHLAADRSTGETCLALIAAANEAGGSDNITVIVARA